VITKARVVTTVATSGITMVAKEEETNTAERYTDPHVKHTLLVAATDSGRT